MISSVFKSQVYWLLSERKDDTHEILPCVLSVWLLLVYHVLFPITVLPRISCLIADNILNIGT